MFFALGKSVRGISAKSRPFGIRRDTCDYGRAVVGVSRPDVANALDARRPNPDSNEYIVTQDPLWKEKSASPRARCRAPLDANRHRLNARRHRSPSDAAGFPYRPTIGTVAIAATWTLGCGASVFVLALNSVWTNTVELETDR